MSELDERLTDKDDVDAIMAALSYQYAQDPDRVHEYLRYGHLQGWQVDEDLSNMKETIFVNPESKQVVFSSKGTNPGHIEDLISDGQLTVTPFREWKKFSRFGKSLEAFDRVRTKYGDEYGYKAVGHSLGGGVALTIADQRGITPLMIECSKGKYCDYDTVKLLVRSAPHHVMDEANDGSTALECALMSGAIDIFRRLQRFHAQELRKESREEMERRRLLAAVSEVEDAVPPPSVEDTKNLVESFSNMARRHSSACSRQAGRHSSTQSQRMSRSSAAA